MTSSISLGLVLAAATLGQTESPTVSAVSSRPFDDENGFLVLVWQFRTEAQRDRELYERLNLRGWHIDYGEGQRERAEWAKRHGWPYYVDHAAGKGILHLTSRSGLDEVPKDGTPAARPWSFFDPDTKTELKRRLDQNVPPVAGGPVAAIALDDEVSLGTFNSPLEIDFSEEAIIELKKWLPTQYGNSAELRSAWELARDEDPRPATYEVVRPQIGAEPPSGWRLAPWIDFRAFMDRSQANMFAELSAYSNTLAPGVPAGVVGGQQPSVYGGFDYMRLRNSVQWMEAYDIGGTNEILHSFWSQRPRRPRMQTYFASGNLSADRWFLWYYLAHGNRGVIVWPQTAGKPWFDGGQVNSRVKQLADTLADVQSDSLSVLSHPDTEPVFSAIAVLYSHPSVQVGWAIDAAVHGKTWPRRSSSLDNSCLSSGKNRIAWTRLLEDLGHQPRFVDTKELVDGLLNREGFKALVLPQAFALSVEECNAIEAFVRRGGSVIADYGTAVTDEHGTGYATSPLDKLFAIDRTKDQGWFDGRGRYEVNGEMYRKPFLERLRTPGLEAGGEFPVVERTLGRTQIANRVGRGRTLFMNSSPTAYFDATARSGQFGERWRQTVGNWLDKIDVRPDVRVVRDDGQKHGVELLRYRARSGREVWAIVANPTRQAAIDGAGSGLALESRPIGLTIRADSTFKVTDLRTGKRVGSRLELPPDEAIILEVAR